MHSKGFTLGFLYLAFSTSLANFHTHWFGMLTFRLYSYACGVVFYTCSVVFNIECPNEIIRKFTKMFNKYYIDEFAYNWNLLLIPHTRLQRCFIRPLCTRITNRWGLFLTWIIYCLLSMSSTSLTSHLLLVFDNRLLLGRTVGSSHRRDIFLTPMSYPTHAMMMPFDYLTNTLLT